MVTDGPVSVASTVGSRTEIIGDRTEFNDTYQNADGSKSLVMSTDPVNYQDSSGAWQPIDSSDVPDSSVANGFRSAANSWVAHFEPLPVGVVVDMPTGQELPMSPQGTSAVDATVTGVNQVTYADAWPGVDLVYTVLPNGVKENIVLHQTPVTASFVFSTGTALFTAELGGALKLASPSYGDFTLAAPEVFDNSGNVVPAAAPTLAPVTLGPLNEVVLSLSEAWLSSLTTTSFPITIDPTLVSDSSNMWASPQGGITSQGEGLRIGYDGNTTWRSGGYFDYKSIYGTYVTNATLVLQDLSQHSNASNYNSKRSGGSEPRGRSPWLVGEEFGEYAEEVLAVVSCCL